MSNIILSLILLFEVSTTVLSQETALDLTRPAEPIAGHCRHLKHNNDFTIKCGIVGGWKLTSDKSEQNSTIQTEFFFNQFILVRDPTYLLSINLCTFLCALFVPPCIEKHGYGIPDDMIVLVPPCRSLCKEARKQYLSVQYKSALV